MTFQSVSILKNSISKDIGYYSELTPDSLCENLFLVDNKPLVDTGIDCPNFSLKISDSHKDDLENVKKMYGTLKDIISPTMASDERLWVGLAMNKRFWKYINTRWQKKGWTESTIKQHYFFGNGNRRSLTRNALARLWWIGYLTYDEEEEADCWHYTEFACKYQRFIVDVLERNTGNSKKIIKSCVKACERFTKDYPDVDIETELMRDIQKYMSIIGGSYLIDMVDSEELSLKIYDKILDIVIPKDVSDESDNKANEDSDRSSASGDLEKVVKDNSIITVEDLNNKKYKLNLQKQKIKTKPKNIEGLKIGSSFQIGNMKVKIIDIK